MPSSNPTTGLGVAAYVHIAGANVTSPSGGTTVHPGAVTNPVNGQGIGATAGGKYPVAQYAVTLSLSGAYGVSSEVELVGSLVDVANNAITNGGYNMTDFVWEAYCAPAPNTEGWYRPNNGSIAGKKYDACVVTLGSSGYGTMTLTLS